ncbi:hypothetical protein TWF694_004397 [Orbilia ellipsospora]|uniref:FAD-dependent urate hydroxylase HpyO/Asp monooxygenase CreE-like FAD/NAD(P)-binding domain-containing protein n=1 Tax=Orbilia ellipsospora TaxID=2528407 RepID=A0AAV9WWA0_9PEZI
MEVAVVKPPRPINVRRIVVVGGGPAALSFLLQFKSKLSGKPVANRAEVVVLETGSHFGPGQGFARSQSPAYRLNFIRELMEPIAGATGNFSAWLRDVAPYCTTEYPPRRFFGIYLEQMGRRLLAETENNPHIEIKFLPHHRAISIESDGSRSSPLRIRYSDVNGGYDRKFLDADEVILCTGTIPCDKYREFQGVEGYGHDTESIRRLMDNLRGDENVGIIGCRLSGTDVAIELRKRGHYGDITMGSHHGLLPTVNTFYTVKEVPSGSAHRQVSYLIGTPVSPPGCFAKSRSSPPPSSITIAENKGCCNGLRYLHPSLIPEFMSLEELTNLFFAEINAIIRDHRDTDTPSAGLATETRATPSLASYEKLADYLSSISAYKWVDQQIEQAERGIIKSHRVLFFQLYPHIARLWSRLADKDKSRYLERFHWVFLAFFTGSPLENAWRMREMLSKGQLTILRDCKFTCDTNGFVMEGRRAERKETESRRISRLFNASGPGRDLSKHPFYSKLFDSGLLRPHRFGGVEFESDTYRAISRANVPNPRLYVIGDATKGQTLITSCLKIISEQANTVAAQVLGGIIEAPPVENCNPVARCSEFKRNDKSCKWTRFFYIPDSPMFS